MAQAPAEALLVSTCNRVELYVTGPGADLPDRTRAALARTAGDDLAPFLYAHHGEAAVLHLFRVAASLDSMVLGEPQILGQVKDAFEQAQRLGAARGELARICAAAFGSAKRVRTETEVGRAATSMAAAAVEMARHIFDRLEGKTVLLVGAGEMAELSGRHLISAGASKVLVVNRTFEHAQALAATLGWTGASPSSGWRRAWCWRTSSSAPPPLRRRSSPGRRWPGPQAAEAPPALPGGSRRAAGRGPRRAHPRRGLLLRRRRHPAGRRPEPGRARRRRGEGRGAGRRGGGPVHPPARGARAGAGPRPAAGPGRADPPRGARAGPGQSAGAADRRSRPGSSRR